MSTLTDRYLAAASKSVTEDQRQEVEAEIAAAIAEPTEARLDKGEEPTRAEREVLLQLGDPMRLAADYSNRQLHLIGPDHFPAYIRLLKLLLAIILPIAGSGVVVAKLVTGADAGEVASTAVLTLIQLSVYLIFGVTLAFAVIERNQTPKSMYRQWEPEMLPDMPAGGVRPGDTLSAVLMTLIGAVYLPWQHFNSAFLEADGTPIPTLAPDLWGCWPGPCWKSCATGPGAGIGPLSGSRPQPTS